ncbi:hypothetical protein FRC00_009290 [Tulasnella sp. 408]|nr:hypothetical protein FRC00_009290 [Tulasnella sp. 408]
MSLNRQFYDFDDPFISAFDPYSLVPRQRSRDRTQSDAIQPFGGVSRFMTAGNSPATRSPNVHLSDEGDHYHVEAEVPGIRKENLDVSIGDSGRSLTIRGGAAVSGSAGGDILEETEEGEATSPGVGKSARGTTSTTEYTETVTTSSTQGGESQPVQRWTSRSSFARTMWLPRPVDPQGVKATLDHGVLTLEIPKLSAQNHRITIA